MGDVFVVGAATTRFGRHGATAADLAHEAVTAAMADADLTPHDVSAAFVASSQSAGPAGADALHLRLGLRRAGLARGNGRRPEHVSASGASALHLASRGVESGLYDVVICLGVEALADDAGSLPAPEALRVRCDAARRYMAASGATVAQLAMTAAKNHRHGADNPAAGTSPQVTARAVLDSDVVAWPLTRLMVAPRASGAAAVVLAARARDRRSVRVRASVLSARAGGDALQDGRAVALAYRRARMGPDDLDCAEVHDVTAAAELAAYEALQLVPSGQGPQLVETGFTALGGVLPVNPSGGLLSLGDLPGASAPAQVAELVRQVRGEARARQVPGARTALALSLAEGRDPGEQVVAVTILGAA